PWGGRSATFACVCGLLRGGIASKKASRAVPLRSQAAGSVAVRTVCQSTGNGRDMTASLPRRALAEFLGTALLVLFGAGSVVAALELGAGQIDYAGLGIISLAFGLVVALIVYGLGTTSGAHINPAVTLSLASVRQFSWAEVPAYLAAQFAGAVGGALLIVAFVGTRATDLGKVGSTVLGTGVSVPQGILAEALGTFLLVFTIMAAAVDKRAPVGWAGFLIGLAVAMEVMTIRPLTR